MTDSALKAEREKRGLSVTGLSRKSGVDPALITHAEKGKRGLSMNNAEAIGEALGVDPDVLYASSNMEVVTKKLASGDATRGQALRTVGRVAGVLKDRHDNGLLDDSPALCKVVAYLEEAALKFSAVACADDLLDEDFEGDEEDETAGEDDGRDFLGRRVTKFSELEPRLHEPGRISRRN
jgi:transcriptional regulator with XRE-family HTH domain